MGAMTRRGFLRAAGMCSVGALLAGAAETAAARKPNVVFILADDLGWRDTALYGSDYYDTPNLARLAARGMRFTQAYAASPLCSATRSSIMTGQWPARTGITSASCHGDAVRLEAQLARKAAPWMPAVPAADATRLDTDHYTLAEAFRDAGYRTGHFGKWHLGREPYTPLEHGYGEDVPHWPGPGPAGGYVAPWAYPEASGFKGEPGEHIEDRMAREAARFIREHRDQPFFLSYWCFSVHGPWGGKPELIAEYAAKADPDSPQRNATYAAMVRSLDDAVGSLLDTLEAEGLTEDTIIVFASDNGGNDFVSFEGVPVTSNAPLRAGKGSIYEGGTRTPLIVVWPGHTPAGIRNDQAIVSSVDYYPTLAEICGIELSPEQRLDGVSIASALTGGELDRGAIYCHYPHNTPATGQYAATYVREGDWKLVRTYFAGPNGGHQYELYNLRDDIGETRNVAADREDKVRSLDARIDRFLAETGAVVPIANPDRDPSAEPPPRGRRVGS